MADYRGGDGAGGAPSDLKAVIGGSGAMYESLALGLAGEIAAGETGRITGLVPQAGTVSGSLVGPGSLSAVNDFYKDWYVVNTDTTPTNGLASQWARVASYDGATRTMTLDKPWNFAAESDFALVKPARLTLLEDLTEDFDATSCVELNLAGHRLQGEIDCSAEEFHRISGAGYVTNGIYKQAFGVLLLENLKVSRRGTEIYCVLLTEGSDLGRCEATNCQFAGRVSGRRGYVGWKIEDCTNDGVSTQSEVNNFAYTLVESVAGIAVVVSAVDVSLNTEIGGAIFYSENSITGPAAYISLNGNLWAPPSHAPTSGVGSLSPANFAVFMASDAATLTITSASGGIWMTIANFRSLVSVPVLTYWMYVRTINAFSGTLSVTLNTSFVAEFTGGAAASIVEVDGPGTTSGSITVAGTATLAFRGMNTVVHSIVSLNATLTGSVTVSQSNVAFNNPAQAIQIRATTTSGAPVVLISSLVAVVTAQLYSWVSVTSGISVSVGTYTVSGAHSVQVGVLQSAFITLPILVTGGTFVFSGASVFSLYIAAASYTHVNISQATGITLTVSGVVRLSKADHYRVAQGLALVVHTGTSGTATISGAVKVFYWSSSSFIRLVAPTGNGAIAGVTGAVQFKWCYSEALVTLLIPSVGATANGPTSVAFDFCTFELGLTTSSGAGTVTWTNCVLTFRHCHIETLFTIVGTNFASVQAFLSTFFGNSANNSILFTGVRPAVYRFWKCVFNGRPDAAGQPEIIDDYVVRPASGTLGAGILATINSSGAAAAAAAGSVVEGILLDAVTVNQRTILVRRGQIYVNSDAGVVAGDSCVLDVATTPTNQIAGAAVVGQKTARALEAAGAVVAGKAYSVVSLM